MQRLDGQIATDVYTTDNGYVALKQPAETGGNDSICLISVDQLPGLIGELQKLYENRERWAERVPEG